MNLFKKTVVRFVLPTIVIWCVTSTFAADPTVDELLDLILNNTGTVTTTATPWQTSTGSVASWSTVWTSDVAPVVTTVAVPSKEPTADEEFKNALAWMYTNGLTQFSTPSAYEPYNEMTRQQAAKFFVVMQETILWKTPAVLNKSCTFSDAWFDPTLRSFVDKACAYGILVGSNGTFRPTAKISRPEFVTALVRMIEWAKRDETGNPRWIQYYQQARDWALTKEQNANAFDVPTTRYEAALFLYRSLAVLKQLNIQTSTNTSTESTETPSVEPVQSQPITPVVSDPILQEAIYWMRDNDMTRYATIELYRPFDTLQRQEAAKIFTLFRWTIIDGTPASDGSSCAFDDLSIADQTLVKYIKDACKLQILKWSNNLFNPEWLLTKPQAVAILIRMLEWPQSETWANWWQVYYDKAVTMWMIEASSVENFDKPISRYEIAKILYNSKVKYDLIKNLNNNYETNKLIYPVPNTQSTWSNSGEIVWLVSINTQALSRTDIDTYVVDLFGNQYKVERQATQKYLSNDYVRYGKMISIDETKDIGTTAFTISNGVIIDWVLRPYIEEQANYFLKPSSQQPYYEMTKKIK